MPREAARRIGYGAVHRETNEILLVAWTRADVREWLEAIPGVVSADYRVERVRVISFVK